MALAMLLGHACVALAMSVDVAVTLPENWIL
jgi:hypothetical protein